MSRASVVERPAGPAWDTSVRQAVDDLRAEPPPVTPLTVYWDDPAGFVRDCFTWRDTEGPTEYQIAALMDLVQRRREALRGPRGLGKSTTASWAVLWFALTRDAAGVDWKIPTTAGSWGQLTHYLWPEIHKWVRRLRWERLGRAPFRPADELLVLSLKLTHGEAFAVASKNSDLIEGAHATELLCVFDEAKTIPAPTWDAIEGIFSGAGGDTPANAYALAISTPGEPNGRFYDIHARRPGYEDWGARHVQLADTVAAGRVSAEWAEQRRRQWGEQSAVYRNHVLGEFATAAADSVIPLAWVEAAQDRWGDWDAAGRPLEAFTCVGVDVGRGGDQTVFALRYGPLITELRRDGQADTMQAAGRVAGVLHGHGGYAYVDVIGIGAGVVDRLREQGHRCQAFNAGAASPYTDASGELGFANRRAEAWWNLRTLLDPQYGNSIALPPDDLLTGDLTAPHWKPTSGGKILVESKDDIRKRLGRSTDDGDAVVMAFAALLPDTEERIVAYDPQEQISPY